MAKAAAVGLFPRYVYMCVCVCVCVYTHIV